MRMSIEMLLFAGEISLSRLQESENIQIINDLSKTGFPIINELTQFLNVKQFILFHLTL